MDSPNGLCYKYNASSIDYYWHDGTRVTNANWKTDQDTSGDCVIINGNGELEKSNCENKEFFVCTLEVPYGSILFSGAHLNSLIRVLIRSL